MDTKTLRTKLGLTQERFAQKVGVTAFTVRRWERTKNPNRPSPLALEKLEAIEKTLRKEDRYS
jgi:putative transcriptional regulator